MNAGGAQSLTSCAVAGSYRVSPGSRVGRAGSIVITVDDRAGWVGGATTTSIRGTIALRPTRRRTRAAAHVPHAAT